MSKAAFCLEGPIYKGNDGQYYGIDVNNEYLSKYYHIADSIVLCTRVYSMEHANSGTKSEITITPLSVVPCPNLSTIKGILFSPNECKRILTKEIINADYVIVKMPGILGGFAIDLAKKLNKPYLIEMVGCPWDSLWNHSLKGKAIAPFIWASTRSYLRKAPYVIYVTNEFLQRRYPTDGKSIGVSDVSLAAFDNESLKNRLKKIDSSKSDDILTIGTTAAVDVRYKGQQFVIEALGRLKKKGITNFRYQLVGGGDQGYLRSVANKHDVSEQVEFLGSIPHARVFDWLDTIDLYAQPSRQEGLPRALVEAMSRGLPAFGARTGGIPELLNNEFLFSNSKRNIEEICALLMGFDKDAMLEQAKRNFHKAKEFESDVLEEKRIGFYDGYIADAELMR